MADRYQGRGELQGTNGSVMIVAHENRKPSWTANTPGRHQTIACPSIGLGQPANPIHVSRPGVRRWIRGHHWHRGRGHSATVTVVGRCCLTCHRRTRCAAVDYFVAFPCNGENRVTMDCMARPSYQLGRPGGSGRDGGKEAALLVQCRIQDACVEKGRRRLEHRDERRCTCSCSNAYAKPLDCVIRSTCKTTFLPGLNMEGEKHSKQRDLELSNGGCNA